MRLLINEVRSVRSIAPWLEDAGAICSICLVIYAALAWGGLAGLS